MTAEQWIAAFATAIDGESASAEETEKLLALAAVAAHSSERIAAPIACWIAGRKGIDLDEARQIAEEIGAGG